MEKNKDKTKILFVCLGNICRSPAAEGVMKHIVKEHNDDSAFIIDSAGIGSWHVGQLPDSRMRRHGASHGYRFDSRARQVSRSDFQTFDMVVAMDDDNRRALLRMCRNDDERRRVVCMADYLRHHPGQADVPDPYYGGDQDFELVIDLLEDACSGLYESLADNGRE